ncbi:MAG: DUF2378 family protein [Myxococcus sp.]|nr:DUF2378 family protein [Myxococcus sp.]
MTEKLIFAQTVEGLIRGLGPLNEQARQQLRACGVDVDRPLRPAYPLEQFLAALDWAGTMVAPSEPSEAQAEAVGRRFMDAYQETMIGRAMVAGLRIIGPWRTLERLSNKFRTGNNFSETRLTRLGPTEAELWCNVVSRPGWYLGLLGRGLELAGAKDVQVRLIANDAEGGRFHVRWA